MRATVDKSNAKQYESATESPLANSARPVALVRVAAAIEQHIVNTGHTVGRRHNG